MDYWESYFNDVKVCKVKASGSMFLGASERASERASEDLAKILKNSTWKEKDFSRFGLELVLLNFL